VFRADAQGRVRFANARWSELVGGPGQVGSLRDLAVEEDREVVDQLVARAGADRGQACSADVRSLAGNTFNLVLRAIGVGYVGPHHLVGVLQEVTDTAALSEQPSRDALTDAHPGSQLARHFRPLEGNGRTGKSW
jgi:PAS domain-containing protein